MSFLNFYILSVVVCAIIGIVELVVRLRKDRKTPAYYSKLTWGDLFVFTVIANIPVLNLFVFIWFPLSRTWDVVERLLEKWDKPIVRTPGEP